MPNIYLATPSHSAKPDVDYMLSVILTIQDLARANIPVAIDCLPGSPYVHLSRNVLAARFLERKEATHLLFWDDDVAAPPEAVRRLIDADKDIIAGIYPKKLQGSGVNGQCNSWPTRLQSPDLDHRGRVQADLPTGFMLIKRHVIEDMIKFYPEREYVDVDPDKPHFDLFPTGLLDFAPRHPKNGKVMWTGEDYAFCLLARKAGFETWLDAGFKLYHAGRWMWSGDFVDEYEDSKEAALAKKAEAAESTPETAEPTQSAA